MNSLSQPVRQLLIHSLQSFISLTT